MSLVKKIAIGVSGALCLVFFILFKLAQGVEKGNQSDTVIYPSGGLSDNLFVSQNSTYVEDKSLDNPYEFEKMPYIVDLPAGNIADVGTGHIVQVADDFVIYVSELKGTDEIHSVVLSQYPKVVYLNYSQDDSYSMTLKEEYGYMNGMPTTYFMDHLIVSTGSNDAKNAYVLGYCYEPENEVNNKVLITVATTTGTTENFEKSKQLLDVVAYTFRYDEGLDRKQISERERAQRELEQSLKSSARSTSYSTNTYKPVPTPEPTIAPSSSTYETVNNNDSSSNTSNNYSSSYGNMGVPISVTKDFTNLSILVTWTNENNDVDIVFKGPRGSIYPDLKTSKQATISVGSIGVGEYSLEFSDYTSLGNVNTKLIENGR